MQPEEVLGLRPGAGPQACRAAYRRLVREHHPDAIVQATAAEREAHALELRRVVAAWEALSLPDALGRADEHDAAVDVELDLDELDRDQPDEDDPDQDVALSSAGLGRAPVMIAMGLVAASFLSFCVSMVMSQTVLWQLSVGLGFAALVSFVLLPFFVMLRGHR